MGFGFIIEVAIVWAGGVKGSCEVPHSSLRLRPLKPLVICYGGRIGVELLLGSHYPANPLFVVTFWHKVIGSSFSIADSFVLK